MVKFVDISQNYGNFKALHHISFDIPNGTLVALLGRNGAGKSTTMSIMTGLRPPLEGEVFINGINIFEEPEKAKRFIGYLGEIPPLYPELTVFEYLHFTGQIHGLGDMESKEKTEKVLQTLQIKDRKNTLIKNLSKGLKQRVGIAQSILHQPKLLVLDEPTVGLEPSQLIEFRNLIRSLAYEFQMTVVISTHIMSEASELCDHVIILNEGQKIFDGSKEMLINQHQQGCFYKVVLESEATEDLLSKIKSINGITSVIKKNKILEIEAQSDNASLISETIVLSKFGLKEISRIKNSLETVFLELTDKKEGSNE
ncbi:MAG: ABC transporter ATP-binding protein [Brevinema sp.]